MFKKFLEIQYSIPSAKQKRFNGKAQYVYTGFVIKEQVYAQYDVMNQSRVLNCDKEEYDERNLKLLDAENYGSVYEPQIKAKRFMRGA